MLIIEGLVMCFILLLICVVGIANGPVGLVIFYEQEVKDRVIEQDFSTVCLSTGGGLVIRRHG